MSIIIHEALQRASFQLRKAGILQPRREAEILLCSAAGLSLSRVYAHPDAKLSEAAYTLFLSWVRRRAAGEPYAYICGSREFMGLDFTVSPAVLIPRPETEILVESALTALKGKNTPRILEIGTGSGAIAVALAVYMPFATITAIDLSFQALGIALANAEKHQTHKRIRFLQGDLYAPVQGGHFDAIISNPPYIPTADILELEPTVKSYEPNLALDGGEDGLNFYRRLTQELSLLGSKPPFFAVEVGFAQADAVCALFYDAGYLHTCQKPDLAGIPRVVTASL